MFSPKVPWTAQNVGLALGSPIVGGAMDALAPAGGFVAAGLAGCAAAPTGWLLTHRSSEVRRVAVRIQKR